MADITEFRWIRIESTTKGNQAVFIRQAAPDGSPFREQTYRLNQHRMSLLNRALLFCEHRCTALIEIYNGGMEFAIVASKRGE